MTAQPAKSRRRSLYADRKFAPFAKRILEAMDRGMYRRPNVNVYLGDCAWEIAVSRWNMQDPHGRDSIVLTDDLIDADLVWPVRQREVLLISRDRADTFITGDQLRSVIADMLDQGALSVVCLDIRSGEGDWVDDQVKSHVYRR